MEKTRIAVVPLLCSQLDFQMLHESITKDGWTSNGIACRGDNGRLEIFHIYEKDGADQPLPNSVGRIKIEYHQ